MATLLHEQMAPRTSILYANAIDGYWPLVSSGVSKTGPLAAARAGMRPQPFRTLSVIEDVLGDLGAVYWARVQLPSAAGRRNPEAQCGRMAQDGDASLRPCVSGRSLWLVARPTISSGIVTRSLLFAGTVLVGSVLLLWPCRVAADSLAEARSVLKQQDFATAHTMFELEARRGNAAAMNELGYLYLRGHGVAQDCKRAYMWFSLAISFASDEALRREAIENQFTAEVNGGLKSRDKSDAHRLGNAWLARYHLE
ncbi:MAG TPA: hypothetical protein VJ822_03115 [Dongiaceae bacterium]|nr:hypothetical protein [Dongiaceae bacterium]